MDVRRGEGDDKETGPPELQILQRLWQRQSCRRDRHVFGPARDERSAQIDEIDERNERLHICVTVRPRQTHSCDSEPPPSRFRYL